MARPLRIEYPGACYHVINRGNYRSYLFKSEGAKKAFEDCLFESCHRNNWQLQAYVIMGNHYHLALETPEANLSTGMQWLQATFANRFNKLREEHGHLFQGRYKALSVEPGDAMAQVSNYIHLNPVRAGLADVETLQNYRYSSYWYLMNRERRPSFMKVETTLAELGGLTDSPQGLKSYKDYLKWQAEEGPQGKTKAYANMSQGWALGSEGFKEKLLDHLTEKTTPGKEAEELRELKWNRHLKQLIKESGHSKQEAQKAKKSSPWKLAIAAKMKNSTDVRNQWLCEELNLGSPAAFSHNLTMFRRGKNQEVNI